MPPRLNVLSVSRSLTIRTRAPVERWRPAIITQAPQSRFYSNPRKDLPVSESKKGPNEDQLPHVSEEAAATSKITGETGPDLSQGTPIEEVVKGDKKAQESLPKVMKDALNAAKKPSDSRSYSTSAIRRQDLVTETGSESVDSTIISAGTSLIGEPTTKEAVKAGVKFGLPSLPLPADYNLHHRYDPVIEQFTGLLIRHGKKGIAQRVSCDLFPQHKSN
jgi:small subunit ribosomal protein S7